MADKESLGRVRIEHDVLAAIAAAAAGKVPGVTRIIPGFVGFVEGLFGRTAPRHSLKVRVTEGRVYFETAIEVAYGSDIPQLSWEVQKAIKEAVEMMTGMKVAGVEVEVRGLQMPGES